MKKFLIIIGFVATIFMATVPTALAVEQLDTAFLPKGMPTLSGSTENEDIRFNRARVIVVQRLLNVVTGSAAIIATFFILYSGFNLVISHGEDDKMGPAKKGLTWALLGLVFIMLSYSIMSFVIKTALSAEDPSAQGEITSDEINAIDSSNATEDDASVRADFDAITKEAAANAAEFKADKAPPAESITGDDVQKMLDKTKTDGMNDGNIDPDIAGST